MPTVTTSNQHRLGEWFAKIQDCQHIPGEGTYIGLEADDGSLLSVCMFESYNQANVNMHIASVQGKRWLTREYLWYCFHYPFVTLGCKRVTGIVPSSNHQARKFDENLGFTLEATLKEAHPDGDLLVYVMTKQQCRWLTLKDTPHGKEQSTSST